MIFKRLLSCVLCLSMLLGLGITGFATDITNETSGETVITYGMDEYFTVVVPADFTIDESKKAESVITASDVMISHGSILNVYISGDDWNGYWELIDQAERTNRLEYIIGSSEGDNDIVNNSIILSVLAGEAWDSEVSETMYFTVVDELTKSGTYTDTLTFIVELDNGIYTPEELERRYDFNYYSTLNKAISGVNHGTIVDESDIDKENKENAVAAAYVDENGKYNVVLLKDSSEMYLWPEKDMTINLGGHTFTSTDNMIMYCPSGNIHIDGRVPGSEMKVVVSDGVPAQGIMVDSSCNLTIDGGTYTSVATNTTSAVVMVRGTVTAQNATFVGESTTGRMDGFCTYAGSTVNISNCDILASGENAHTYGVFVGDNSDVTIDNSRVKGYANYNHNGNTYSASSLGIYQSANSMLNLNNCYVAGTLAGIQTYGTIYVNGGVYEGYGHGGFYFTGNSTKSYVRNATIRESSMPDGYTNNNGTNHVGLYIGTGSSNSIYMDNCNIESTGHAVVLRGSSGDSLYISNSRIGEDREIRIDSMTHKLYIGAGNNFGADDTTLPDAVIETNETYVYNG